MPPRVKDSKKDELAALKRYEYLLKFAWRCQAPGPDGCPTDGHPHPGHPFPHARRAQLPPRDSYIWLLLSGRGFGKTRSGAEFVKERMMGEPGHRVAIVAPDFSTGRDICLEGESGLRGVREDQGVIPWEFVKTYNRSMGELVLTNGSMVKLFGTDSEKDAEKLRGYQAHTLWFEELATQEYGQTAWDNAEFCLRLGTDPKIVVTTTPRPLPIIKNLLKDPDVSVTRGTTYDNAANLPARTVARLKNRYEGTTLGQQELFGEVLDVAEGALFDPSIIHHKEPEPNSLVQIVVAVDPAGSHKKSSDETGIIVAGMDNDNIVYLLADYSGRYTPEGWSDKVVSLYNEYNAGHVTIESNYGGAMCESTLRSASQKHFGNPHALPIVPVSASLGKVLRAEPVVALYEQGRVFHAERFAKLEEQMMSWTPPGRFDADNLPIKPSPYSPDRMDAAVYAITDLALSPKAKKGKLVYHGS